MKYFLTIVWLITASLTIKAQSILLKVDLNDCITCRSGMLNLSPNITGLPAFAVFPESAREDSIDIEFAGRFGTANIQLKFNDFWFSKSKMFRG